MSKYNLTKLAEGMGYKEFEDAKEEERLDKHPDKEMIKKVQAMMAKVKPQNEDYKNDYANSEEDFTDSMVIEKIKDIIRYHELDPQDLIDEIRMEFGVDAMDEIVGYDRKGNKQTGTDVSKATQYKASAMKKDDDDEELDESFDSLAKKLDKQKGITKDEAGKIAGSIAAKKMKGAGKGPTAKQKKRVAEADAIPTSAGKMKRGDDGKMYNVIASNAERKMAMRSVMDILRDELSVSQDDAFDYIKTHRDDLFDGTVDAFDIDDVVDDYKNYESVNEASDTFNIDKVASPDAKARDYGDEIKGISDEDDTEEKYAHQIVTPLEEDDYTDRKRMSEGVVKSIMQVLKDNAKATNDEIKQYLSSLMRSGDSFDDLDDYVEDFKEYVADKSLREHFGRFMKDYQ